MTHHRHAQQARDIDPMPGYCWPTVHDASPPLSQQWINALCLLRQDMTYARGAEGVAGPSMPMRKRPP